MFKTSVPMIVMIAITVILVVGFGLVAHENNSVALLKESRAIGPGSKAGMEAVPNAGTESRPELKTENSQPLKSVPGQTLGPDPIPPSVPREKEVPVAVKCRPEAAINGLAVAQDGQLRRLAVYQDLCGSRTFDQMMVFTYLPKTKPEAAEMAAKMSLLLNEYYFYGIAPVVIVEPVDENGDFVLFKGIADGEYDSALDGYFSALKEAGATGSIMGLWVPLPEPNINEWGPNNNDPDGYVAAFNRYAGILKNYFSDGRLSVLLDSQTYDQKTGDYAAVSLEPYLKGLDKTYLSAFGLQAFPDTDKDVSNDAGFAIDSKLAVESAKQIGVGSVWFNTGTYSTARSETGDIIDMPAADRTKILEEILRKAVIVKSLDYQTTINLFAEDKSQIDERIDWSYLKTAKDRQTLLDFITRVNLAGIALSLYDSVDDQ